MWPVTSLNDDLDWTTETFYYSDWNQTKLPIWSLLIKLYFLWLLSLIKSKNFGTKDKYTEDNRIKAFV